ncbi:MAG: membrane protein insertase YidC, partial [Spirochaetes bacterium]
DINAFELYFGDNNVKPLQDLMYYSKPDENTIVFYRNFKIRGDESGAFFTLKKTYVFKPNDYLFELRVALENSVNQYLPFNYNGYSYTLGYGPQIGPYAEKLNGRYEYRKYYTYSNGKRINNKLKTNDEKSVANSVFWSAIVGKYFTVIAVPDSTNYRVTFSNKQVEGVNITSQMFLSRPLIKSSKNEDVYRFYVGPKLKSALASYDKADKNGFGVQDLNLEEVIDTSSILGWLEWILLQILHLSYKVIPNYGIAIIILTIIIKTVLFPFTHKSFESTSRMQALTPKINELKEKYKDNPTKMNTEMQALYKKENVNPMGGCLPMLLQMPIFFALYGLLNKYFQLRGAVFIPGWITDLSSPESILSLPFTIPIVGWSDIRLLPILFTLTMILSNKMMKNPSTEMSASGGDSMKMMTTLMPVMFFFIMYNSPSGLLLYWTLTNVITAGQQKYISNKLIRKKS